MKTGTVHPDGKLCSDTYDVCYPNPTSNSETIKLVSAELSAADNNNFLDNNFSIERSSSRERRTIKKNYKSKID